MAYPGWSGCSFVTPQLWSGVVAGGILIAAGLVIRANGRAMGAYVVAFGAFVELIALTLWYLNR